MASDYIPATDDGLSAFSLNFINTLGDEPELFGLILADVTALIALRTIFATALTAHTTAASSARTARQTKDVAAKNLRTSLRALTRRVQVAPGVTDAQRATLQVTIPDRVPSPIPAPTTAPILEIDFSTRQEHQVHFFDQATPNSKAKPAGAVGMDLWAKVTDVQPLGISTMEYIGTCTSSPKRLQWEESNFGQQIFYIGCWVTAKGLRGPMSDFTNATLSK